MKVNKKSLQDALGIVKPGLAGKEVIEQSTSFAFIAGHVVTYNDEISLSHPVEGLNFEGAIESDKLYQFLTKIKQEEIDLEVNDNEIIVTAGKAKAGLSLQSEIKLPLDDELGKKGKWKTLPESFVKFVDMAIPSCSTMSTKPLLGAVHITSEGIIEASDGYRITHCTLPEGQNIPVKTFLLPSKSARLMTGLNPVQIAEGRGWVHFKTEAGTILSCRILESDEFPNTAAHLKIKGTKIIFPKTIPSIMERAGVFSKDEAGDIIQVHLEDKKLTIKARNNIAWFEEQVNTRYEGDTIDFQINPNLLKGILSETQEGELSKNKLLFQGEGWIYLTTLMYIK